MAKVVLDLEARIKGLEQSLDQVNTKLKGVGDQSNKSTQKVNQNFQSVTDKTRKFAAYFGATIGGVAVVGAIKKSIDAMKEFEQTFTNVLTLLSAAERKKFGDFLKQGSLDLMTKYGFAIQDVNKAMFDAISAGVKAGDSIRFMDEAAKLAIAGVTSLGTAVDGMTSIMNAYRLSAKDAEKVSAAFFTAQKFGKTTVEELANNIGKLAPIAASAGIGFQEMLTGLALLTAQGISTEESTTALRATISALINPAEDARKTFNSLGIETGLVALRQNGLGKTLLQVAQAAETNADKLSEMIPNVRALTAVAALGEEALKDYDKILKEVETDYGETSSMAQAFRLQQDTVANAMKRMGATIKVNMIGLGNVFAPLIKGLANLIAPIEESSDALIKQKSEIDILIGSAIKLNEEDENRKKLIEELNTKYPELLKNYDIEKITNQELVGILKDVNVELEKRIELAVLEEIYAKQKEKLVALGIKEYNLIKELTAAEIQLTETREKGLDTFFDEEEVNAIERALKRVTSQQEDLRAETESTLLSLQKQREIVKEVIEDSGKDVIAGKVTDPEYDASLKKAKDFYDKAIGELLTYNAKAEYEQELFITEIEHDDTMHKLALKSSQEDFNDAMVEIDKRDKEAAEQREEDHQKRLEDIEELKRRVKEEAWDSAFRLVDTFAALNEAAMNKELAAAGDNEAKKDEIRKKYAKKDQGMAVMRAIISGAEGIVKTGATLGFPLAIPFQILQGLQTLAQIALIKSVKFAKGGYKVLEGRRHHEGGTMTPIGEGERGEGHAIFSRWATEKYGRILPDLVDSINKGRFLTVDTDIGNRLDAKEKLMKFMHRISLDDSKQLEEIKNILSRDKEQISITTDKNGNSYMVTRGRGYIKRMKLR